VYKTLTLSSLRNTVKTADSAQPERCKKAMQERVIEMRRLSRLVIALTVAVTVAATGGGGLAAPVPAGGTSTAGVLHISSKSCGWDISLTADPTYDSNGRLKTVLPRRRAK
jgi:hypothetical protein